MKIFCDDKTGKLFQVLPPKFIGLRVERQVIDTPFVEAQPGMKFEMK